MDNHQKAHDLHLGLFGIYWQCQPEGREKKAEKK